MVGTSIKVPKVRLTICALSGAFVIKQTITKKIGKVKPQSLRKSYYLDKNKILFGSIIPFNSMDILKKATIIPNKVETTTSPAFKVTEILASTYATIENIYNTLLNLASNRFIKNYGIV